MLCLTQKAASKGRLHGLQRQKPFVPVVAIGIRLIWQDVAPSSSVDKVAELMFLPL